MRNIDKFKKIMIEKRLTIKQAAIDSGIEYQKFYRIINGWYTTVEDKLIENIENVLGKDAGDILRSMYKA